MDTLGRVAYQAYADDAGWKAFNGDMLPNWEDLPSEIRQHWEVAAAAVLRER